MGKSWSYLTKEQFDLAKTLLEKGTVSQYQIGKIVGKSQGTVHRMSKYNTIEEFRQATKDERYGRYAKKDEKVPTPSGAHRQAGVTQEQFDMVKLLKNNGVDDKNIGPIVKLHPQTVKRINEHETLDAYRKWRTDYLEAYRAKKAEEKKVVSDAPKEELTDKTFAVPEKEPVKLQVGFIGVGKDTSKPSPSPFINQSFDFNLLNQNIVLLAEKLEKYALAVENLTIATYALRKTNKGETDVKPFWKRS